MASSDLGCPLSRPVSLLEQFTVGRRHFAQCVLKLETWHSLQYRGKVSHGRGGGLERTQASKLVKVPSSLVAGQGPGDFPDERARSHVPVRILLKELQAVNPSVLVQVSSIPRTLGVSEANDF